MWLRSEEEEKTENLESGEEMAMTEMAQPEVAEIVTNVSTV